MNWTYLRDLFYDLLIVPITIKYAKCLSRKTTDGAKAWKKACIMAGCAIGIYWDTYFLFIVNVPGYTIRARPIHIKEGTGKLI